MYLASSYVDRLLHHGSYVDRIEYPRGQHISRGGNGAVVCRGSESSRVVYFGDHPEDDIGVLILHSRIDLLDQPPEPESIGLNAPPQRRPTARPLSDCLECFLPSNIINTICAGAPDHAKGGRCELLETRRMSRHRTPHQYEFIRT